MQHVAESSALPLHLQVIGVEEDVSVYDIADHPDFHFRTTDIVIRIWNSDNAENECDNEVRLTVPFGYLLIVKMILQSAFSQRQRMSQRV